jgi:hypothetical protein
VLDEEFLMYDERGTRAFHGGAEGSKGSRGSRDRGINGVERRRGNAAALI